VPSISDVSSAQWLDNHKDSLHVFWRPAIYLLYRLMDKYSVRPQTMSVNNCQISRIEDSVIASGGASTVYIGKWRRKQVAVKHVHVGKDAKEVIVVKLHLGISLISGLTGLSP
jgi:hypothetical protein